GRWADAATFGMALGELRAKFAPEASEDQLGELLRQTFKRESAAEISILERLLAEANPLREPAGAPPAPAARPPPAGTRPMPPRETAPEREGTTADEEEPETTGGQLTQRASAPPTRRPPPDPRAKTVAE